MKKQIASLLTFAMLFTVACDAKSKETSASDISSDMSSESSADPSETTVAFPSDQYEYKYQWYATMTPEEITATLTLEQKAAQMVQPIMYMVSQDEEAPFSTHDYGSLYGDEGEFTAEEWRTMLDGYQREAIESEAGIPYLVAQDNVHGVGYCIDAVYFPHNIGVGAANDEELAYQMGLIAADEAKQCHILWNLYPCVAQSDDPRWGRNYECYSSDLETITRLSTAYTKGLIDGGMVATAKHFFGDGNVLIGTGEKSDFWRLIDRGDARLSEEEINELLKVYQAQIDAGVQAIMVSYSSLNGTKMHENKEYLEKLRTEMGFTGVIMSDSMAIQNTSPATFEEQVISAINCGIDLLMEGIRYDDARTIIIDAVNDGKISMERIDEAVTRIIKLKKDAGVFDDPFCENISTVQQEVGSLDYRAVAEKLVEESLVLVKNENETLPLKEGTKVYITGPAADNPRAQCGGWTMGWNQSPKKEISGVTTIKEAFERYAEEYGIEVITDPSEANKADVVLLCVGENAYAEWNGDATTFTLCTDLGLPDNRDAIEEAKALGKPTVTCIIAGRQLIIDPADYDSWDSLVMCYLPGSEGKGISDVLCGCADFTGRLPEPWYSSIEQIGTAECKFERGYGLSYPNGFTPRQEPVAVLDVPSAPEERNDPMVGTNYVRGEYSKDGTYKNEYAGLTISIPSGMEEFDEEFCASDIQGTVDMCTSEKDAKRESSMIIDSWFNREEDFSYIEIKFLNTSLGVPEDPDYTEEKYLNDRKEFFDAMIRGYGITPNYNSRETVMLGEYEYLKESATFEGGLFCWYVRKIDENVMVVIETGRIENAEALFS
ncbi:MAG: glycoside hydrolase family 3 protein [Clostridiales bacterium]|nr:glycoside hydrolase family 3 protein [Clostridiales bacterium]